MSRGSNTLRPLLYLILIAVMASLGYSVFLGRTLLKVLPYFLILEGGILFILFGLSKSRSLRAQQRGVEETERWVRTLEGLPLLRMILVLLILGFLIDLL